MNIGRRLSGYCDDFFEYGNYLRVIIAEGFDWIVVCCPETDANIKDFAYFANPEEKQIMIDKWENIEN